MLISIANIDECLLLVAGLTAEEKSRFTTWWNFDGSVTLRLWQGNGERRAILELHMVFTSFSFLYGFWCL